jgi:hypothetical protein
MKHTIPNPECELNSSKASLDISRIRAVVDALLDFHIGNTCMNSSDQRWKIHLWTLNPERGLRKAVSCVVWNSSSRFRSLRRHKPSVMRGIGKRGNQIDADSSACSWPVGIVIDSIPYYRVLDRKRPPGNKCHQAKKRKEENRVIFDLQINRHRYCLSVCLSVLTLQSASRNNLSMEVESSKWGSSIRRRSTYKHQQIGSFN